MPAIELRPGFFMFAIVLAALDRSGSVLPILCAMAVHELAHIVMMLACGGQVRRLTLRFADLQIAASGLGYRQELLSAKLPYNAACRGLFARPLHPLGSSAKANLQPHGTVPALPRRSRRVRPRIRKLPTAKITYNTAREFSFSPHHRSK